MYDINADGRVDLDDWAGFSSSTGLGDRLPAVDDEDGNGAVDATEAITSTSAVTATVQSSQPVLWLSADTRTETAWVDNSPAARQVISIPEAAFEVSNAPELNVVGPFTQKTLAFHLTTGADVQTRQVIWEQGGDRTGLNVYIEAGTLYFGSWHLDAPSPADPVYLAYPIAAETDYRLVLVMDAAVGTLQGWSDGESMGTVTGVVPLSRHTDAIGLGQALGSTRFHTGFGGGGHLFSGRIDEVMQYNVAADEGLRAQIEARLARAETPPIIEEERSDPIAVADPDVSQPITSGADARVGAGTGASLMSGSTPGTTAGKINRYVWRDLAGTTIQYFTDHMRYPHNFDSREYVTALDFTDEGDAYGTRIRGYIQAPADGDYTFWIAGSDQAELWLSSDSDPANVSRVAYTHWDGAYQDFDHHTEQASAPITLQAGNWYYIDVLHKEAGADGHLSVAWQIPGGTREIISGSYLSPFDATIHQTTIENVAVNKPAGQDSLAFSGLPGRAVDGNTSGVWGEGSVSHTDGSAKDYWEVDLGGNYDLTHINIWNRTDCCSEWLDDFYVLVSDTPFTSDTLADVLVQSGVWSTHVTTLVNPMQSVGVDVTGRYVRVQQNTADPLTLAEVEVFAAEPTTAFTALTEQGITRQVWLDLAGGSPDDVENVVGYPHSYDYAERVELFHHAGDKNRRDAYGALYQAYVQAPVSGDYTFWIGGNDQADLYLSNNHDPANKRLIALSRWGNTYQDWDAHPLQASQDILLEAGEWYYIEVVHKEGGSNEHLSVAWQVPGGQRELLPAGRLAPFRPQSLRNAALNKAAVQSSTDSDGIATNATDGDRNGDWFAPRKSVAGTLDETNVNSWWEVDLRYHPIKP